MTRNINKVLDNDSVSECTIQQWFWKCQDGDFRFIYELNYIYINFYSYSKAIDYFITDCRGTDFLNLSKKKWSFLGNKYDMYWKIYQLLYLTVGASDRACVCVCLYFFYVGMPYLLNSSSNDKDIYQIIRIFNSRKVR